MLKDSMKPKPYTKASIPRDIPKRKKTDSKVQGGRVGVIAGSPGMWGAGVLAAEGASRSGAGYVYLLAATPKMLIKHPDFLFSSESQIRRQALSAVVIGPGFKKPAVAKWLRHWQQTVQKNVILDAEALNWLALHPKQVLHESWVLTPHEGEMGRLLKKSRLWVHAHREEAVLRAQKKWHCIVVLKGASTLVANGEKFFSVQAGNPSLGKAGSGDVLAGMIAAFLAQNQSTGSAIRAVCAAVFVHGWIADQWVAAKKDTLSLRPVDLLARLPAALSTLRKH